MSEKEKATAGRNQRQPVPQTCDRKEHNRIITRNPGSFQDRNERKENNMEKIKFDTTELYNRIIKQYGSIKAFAAVIGMNPRTLARRLDGSTVFYAKEIEAIYKVMNLDAKELNLYFFTKKGKHDEQFSVVHGMTEEQYKLTLEIAELISGRPDRCEIMRKWTGNINDLVTTLAQI